MKLLILFKLTVQVNCTRYQYNLETSLEENKFIFDSVQLIYYKCQKVNFQHGDLYVVK